MQHPIRSTRLDGQILLLQLAVYMRRFPNGRTGADDDGELTYSLVCSRLDESKRYLPNQTAPKTKITWNQTLMSMKRNARERRAFPVRSFSIAPIESLIAFAIATSETNTRSTRLLATDNGGEVLQRLQPSLPHLPLSLRQFH
jgi:hypothetical protein